MNTDIDQMLDLMDRTFQDFESSMPNKPQMVRLSYGMDYRYKEKDIYQAMIQKLARVLSAVRAARLLLNNGFVQEQAMLHRIIDETNEDIFFLAYAAIDNNITELHQRYLDTFWEEEIDESGNMLNSRQKRPMILRRKIHDYISKKEGKDIDSNTYKEVMRTIHKTYSGFVHGASPQIMNMYGGDPPHFHTNGLIGTPRMEEHADDLWNYVYRSYLSYVIVAKALGAAKHVEILDKHLKTFENNAGMKK